jgi:hypothetical protein
MVYTVRGMRATFLWFVELSELNLWVSANGCNSLLCHIPWVSSFWKYSEVKKPFDLVPFVWPRVPYSPFLFLGTLVLDHLPKVSHATRWTSHAGLLCARPMPQKYVYVCGNVPVLPLLILYKYWNEKRKEKKQFKVESEPRKIVIISRPIGFDGTKNLLTLFRYYNYSIFRDNWFFFFFITFIF